MRALLWKAILALSLGANAALGTAMVLSRAGGGAPSFAADDSSTCLLDSLGLDEAQRAVVERLRSDFERFREGQRVEMRAARERLFEAIAGPQLDRARVDALLGQLGALQVEMRGRLLDQIVGIRDALRPDQREKYMAGVRERFVSGGHHGGAAEHGGACPAAGGGASDGGGRP
jgi:Spy/CpxP family protein refolding chaperone